MKVAYSLQIAQITALDLETVENRINYVSNNPAVNSSLLCSDDEKEIGWLQNSKPLQREETVNLLLENRSYLFFVKGVQDIMCLVKLNSARLFIEMRSGGYCSQSDLTKVFNQNKLGLDDFIANKEIIADILRGDKLKPKFNQILKGVKK